MKKKAVIVSGYFNPIHKGHLEYFNNAKAIADELIVVVNNDHQRALKGSKEFQGEEERIIIVSNIKAVDRAILSLDEDRTVCATLEKIAQEFGFRIKLIAHASYENNILWQSVHPALISDKEKIANIDGSLNAVLISTSNAKWQMMIGAGAGSLPTASAVIADIIEISKQINCNNYVPTFGYQIDDLQDIVNRDINQKPYKFFVRVNLNKVVQKWVISFYTLNLIRQVPYLVPYVFDKFFRVPKVGNCQLWLDLANFR
mgnify:CR=1 FL=1